MRQRYLLGKANMQRYSEKYQLLDPNGTADQVGILSTDYIRTIQSGYSEMMGMFPPDVNQS
jgi:hypothetical protein